MLSLALLFALKFTPPTPELKYQQPQVASTGDMVGVVFSTPGKIFYSHSENDGQTFSRPTSIAVQGHMALGRHRGPRITYQSGNVVVSAVVGEHGMGKDGDLLVWTSDDNGKEWKKPVKVNDVPGSAREGLHAMASGNGWVIAVWLDLREKGTRLYGAKSTDGGATWSKNFLVYESPDGSICQCCHPSVMVGPSGIIHVMFRNAVGGSRDMYWIRSDNGAKTWYDAKKIGIDTWKLDACPMDGGGFTVSADGAVQTVWRRDKTIFVSRNDGKENALGTGKDASIAAGINHELYVVWTGADGSLQARSRKDNAVRTLAPSGGHPQIVFTGRSVLAFFEQDGGIGMESVDAHPMQNSR